MSAGAARLGMVLLPAPEPPGIALAGPGRGCRREPRVPDRPGLEPRRQAHRPGRQGVCLRLAGDSTVVASNLAFSPDGKRIARASGGAMVRCWDSETGEELMRLRSQDDALLCVAFSPDGRWLATGGLGTITLWDARTGHAVRTIRGHDGPVFVVAFSPDGHRIASGMSTRIDATVKPEIKIWDLLNGHELGVSEMLTGVM